MRLAVFEDPIRTTIQGDGVLLGMPMTFVRMHGCDYSCDFCDTKDTWKPGSPFEERSVEDIAHAIKKIGLRHVSITGGNPLLQEEELYQLLKLISPKHRVLVETQASIFSERVFEIVDLASLSPKLHAWQWDPLLRTIDTALGYGNSVQLKIVTTSDEDVAKTLEYFEAIDGRYGERDRISYILLPEYSLGRSNVKRVISGLAAWAERRRGTAHDFDVRVIPQLHKLTLFVP